MMSKPASVTSYAQGSPRDEPSEAAKIPLRGKGLDIASQMQSVKCAEPDLMGAVGDYSVSVAQTLDVIEAIEATLQQKRGQIQEIQARQEILAREYRQLGRTLDAAARDLAEQFIDIIADLESGQFAAAEEFALTQNSVAAETTNGSGLGSPGTRPPEANQSAASVSGVEAPAEIASGAREAEFERSAEKTAEATAETGAERSPEKAQDGDRALDLDLELSELPPVPEFLGGSQEAADKSNDGAGRASEAGSRPWWKHAKKG